MSDIFISYATEDREWVRTLVAGLEETGWSLFWDRHTPLGLSWEEHIVGKLEEARCVVVVWTEASTGSDFVKDEAREGLKKGVLIPVFRGVEEAPIGFRSRQGLDLSGWDGGSDASELKALVAGMARLLGAPPSREKEVRSEAEEVEREQAKARARAAEAAGNRSTEEGIERNAEARRQAKELVLRQVDEPRLRREGEQQADEQAREKSPGTETGRPAGRAEINETKEEREPVRQSPFLPLARYFLRTQEPAWGRSVEALILRSLLGSAAFLLGSWLWASMFSFGEYTLPQAWPWVVLGAVVGVVSWAIRRVWPGRSDHR